MRLVPARIVRWAKKDLDAALDSDRKIFGLVLETFQAALEWLCTLMPDGSIRGVNSWCVF